MSRALTSGHPLKLIVRFAVPVLLGLLFQQLYQFVDAVVVGRVLGVQALAAVGASGGIFFLLLGFTMGTANGFAIPVARAFGAGDEAALRRSVASGAILAGGLAVIMAAGGIPLARQLLVWLQTPAEILPQATTFLTVMLAGSASLIAFNYLSSIIRALGDSTTPLIFLAISSLLNVGLVLALIGWAELGIAGAALATVLAQTASVVACLGLVNRKMPQLRPRREDWRPARADLAESLRMGLPMGFQMSIIAIGALVLQWAINGLGTDAVAAFTAGSRVDQLAMAPLQALAVATSTFVAQNRGAAAWSRIALGVKQTARLGVATAVVVGLACVVWGDLMIAAFLPAGSGGEQIARTAHTMLLVNGSLYTLLALLFVFRAGLQGMGDTAVPTFTGVIELLLRSAAAILLVDWLGFLGAALAAPLAWLGAAIPLWWAWGRRRREFATWADGAADPRERPECQAQRRDARRRRAQAVSPVHAAARARARARDRAAHQARVRQCDLAAAAVLADLAAAPAPATPGLAAARR